MARPSDDPGEHPISGRLRLVDRNLVASDARALVQARGEVGGQGDGSRHAVFAEAHQLSGNHGGARRAVQGAGAKPAGCGARDEVVAQPEHNFIPRRQGGDDLPAVPLLEFGVHDRGRDQHGTGVGQHPVGIEQAGGVHQLGVCVGCADAGCLAAMEEDGCAVGFSLFRKGESDRLPGMRRRPAKHGTGQGVEHQSLDLVHHFRRQILIPQAGSPPCELPAD